MKPLLIGSFFIPLVIVASSFRPSSQTSQSIAAVSIQPSIPKTICQGMPGFISRKWEIEEIRFLQDNQPYYYKRGDRAESNMNFDNDWIIFNCDGTGRYHQSNNIEYDLNWELSKGKIINLEYSISNFRYNSDLKVKLEDIKLDNDRISYTEYYTHKNKTHSLGVVKRISEIESEESVVANRY